MQSHQHASKYPKCKNEDYEISIIVWLFSQLLPPFAKVNLKKGIERLPWSSLMCTNIPSFVGEISVKKKKIRPRVFQVWIEKAQKNEESVGKLAHLYEFHPWFFRCVFKIASIFFPWWSRCRFFMQAGGAESYVVERLYQYAIGTTHLQENCLFSNLVQHSVNAIITIISGFEWWI